jgi:HAD superfamily hydrolase (TIGR01549 family)
VGVKFVLRITSFLFDLDGTIWDSNECITTALSEAFASAGIKLTRSDVVHELESYASPIALLKARGLSRDLFWMAYRENIGKIRMYFDSTSSVFEALRSRGRKIGFVTSLKGEIVEFLLVKFGLKQYSDIVITQLQCPIPKPNPASLNLALMSIKANPREALYTGNQASDVAAAHRANCWSALAKWGATENIKPKADYEFENLNQVLALAS